MKNIDKVGAVIIAVTILSIVVVAFALHLKSKEVAACQKSVEIRYNYLERKLCDPYRAEACYIDPELRAELDEWHKEELQACK